LESSSTAGEHSLSLNSLSWSPRTKKSLGKIPQKMFLQVTGSHQVEFSTSSRNLVGLASAVNVKSTTLFLTSLLFLLQSFPAEVDF
jgi:hypothetical protein